MGETCLIMMTSYNGEKYIAEQIESIRKQTHKNWELIIQDDMSQDNTIGIIQSFMEKDQRIHCLINKKRLGAYPNWHTLINYCKSLDDRDYYVFCDQDDIWYKNKLEKMIAYHNKKSSKLIPTLIYADMKVINAEGCVVASNFAEDSGQVFCHPYDIFYKNCVYGCNVFLNKALFKAVPEVQIYNKRPHDAYYAMFAVALGKLIHMPETTMKYRRHGNNVSHIPIDFGWKRIVRRLIKIQKLAKDHSHNYSQALYVFDVIKEHNIIVKNAKQLNAIEKSIRSGGIYGLTVFLKLHVYCGNRYRTISRALILLSGSYKKYLDVLMTQS